MGRIHILCFTTLDLVGQAPGGPQEDPVGFDFGGWQAPLLDDVSSQQVAQAYRGTDALLLGRRTYEMFADHWPHQGGGRDDDIASLFNRVPKYVVSRGRPDLSWAGSVHVKAGDHDGGRGQAGSAPGASNGREGLAAAIDGLRERHEDIKVVGSLNLVQTLLRQGLFDRLDLWVHPVLLGAGKKVFAAGAVPATLELLGPPVASSKGVVHLRYARGEGVPGTGDMGA